MTIWNQTFTTIGMLAVGFLAGASMTAQAGEHRVVVGSRHIDVTRNVYPAPVVQHYPNTVIYGRTPRVIYQGAPTVVIATPYLGLRSFNGYQSYPRSGHHGWTNRSGNSRYCAPNQRRSTGHYRGQGQRRW